MDLDDTARIERAAPSHPIDEVLACRSSPRAFSDRPVTQATLLSLFEAARRAPSCFVFAGRWHAPVTN